MKQHDKICVRVCAGASRSPVDSMREAVLTVSPKRQYRGIVRPTTPATHGPEKHHKRSRLTRLKMDNTAVNALFPHQREARIGSPHKPVVALKAAETGDAERTWL